MTDIAELADAIESAFAARTPSVPLPSAQDPPLDLTAAYGVEAEIVRRRAASGHRPVGLKVGYANKAVWRALKLETLVWAHMYDDTVSEAHGNRGALSIDQMIAPKIEPEIVLALARSLPAGLTEATSVLEHVAWIALGFEIIDCPYPDWSFQPPDFVAARGLHAALVVGEPIRIDDDNRPALVESLATFTVSLERDGVAVATGSGKNSLRSPALCLAELASARQRRGDAPLAPGSVVSSGTLTDSQRISAGEQWTARVGGLPTGDVVLRIES